jgi:hypothetical protein
MRTTPEHCQSRNELIVLGMIVIGLVAILLSIVLGLFIDNNGLPNWAENVLVSVATATALKFGDAINALIALATGRQVENLGQQLGQSVPTPLKRPVPEDAKEAAGQVADAAEAEAADIRRQE